VYVEAEAPLAEPPGWKIHKHGKAGNVCYHLLKLIHDS
jgi:16S rRNA (guanine966-N2)-methyltransferase